MKAIVAHAAKDLRLEDRAPEAQPGPGEVLIEMAAGGGSAGQTCITTTTGALVQFACGNR